MFKFKQFNKTTNILKEDAARSSETSVDTASHLRRLYSSFDDV